MSYSSSMTVQLYEVTKAWKLNPSFMPSPRQISVDEAKELRDLGEEQIGGRGRNGTRRRVDEQMLESTFDRSEGTWRMARRNDGRLDFRGKE